MLSKCDSHVRILLLMAYRFVQWIARNAKSLRDGFLRVHYLILVLRLRIDI